MHEEGGGRGGGRGGEGRSFAHQSSVVLGPCVGLVGVGVGVVVVIDGVGVNGAVVGRSVGAKTMMRF